MNTKFNQNQACPHRTPCVCRSRLCVPCAVLLARTSFARTSASSGTGARASCLGLRGGSVGGGRAVAAVAAGGGSQLLVLVVGQRCFAGRMHAAAPQSQLSMHGNDDECTQRGSLALISSQLDRSPHLAAHSDTGVSKVDIVRISSNNDEPGQWTLITGLGHQLGDGLRLVPACNTRQRTKVCRTADRTTKAPCS